MLEAFRLGGFGMFPTLGAGLFLLYASALFARNPERSKLLSLVLLSVLTLSTGALGFVSGLMATLNYAAGKPDQHVLIATGTYESLHNLGFALTFVCLATFLTAFGAWRKAPAESRQPARS
jgi:hypothetical protein